MLNKLRVVLASYVALVALMGFSTTAFGNHVEGELHDPLCAGTYEPGGFGGGPTGWDYGFNVFDFQIDSTDSQVEYAVSGTRVSATACGSTIGDGGVGAGTIINHADVQLAPGVEVADTGNVPNNSWAGTATVNVLYLLGSAQEAKYFGNLAARMQTSAKSDCVNQEENELVNHNDDGHPEGYIVACLKGSNAVGYNYSWITREDDERLTITIGPIHLNAPDIVPGLTYLDLELCGYFGSVNGDRCGNATEGSSWQQKNGRSPYWYAETGCPADRNNGVYSITVTNEGSETTYPVDATPVPWTIAGSRGGNPLQPKLLIPNKRCASKASGHPAISWPDVTPPETTITSGPPDPSDNDTATFEFESSESGSTFKCKLDDGAWSACSSPKTYEGLSLGQHTFSVRATDKSGNTDSTPATHDWTVVDVTPPETTITSGPPDPSGNDLAAFEFESSKSGGTFECRLDGYGWTDDGYDCTSPETVENLSDGWHVFYVRATDGAGNTDPTPAEYTWTVNVSGGISIDLLTNANVRIDGAASSDWAGYSVSDAGDVNGDGRDDVIVGAHYADNNGSTSGSAYVIYGSASLATIDLRDLGSEEGSASTAQASWIRRAYRSQTQEI